MRKSFRAFIILAFFSSSTIQSQTLVFDSPPVSFPQFSIYTLNGSFFEQAGSLASSSANLNLHWDADNETVTFSNTQIHFEHTINLSGDFAVAGGNTITIEGRIEFDATLQFVDTEALSTTARLNNRFDINNFDRALTGTNSITGNYSFSGPTETVSDTFSFDPGWSRNSFDPWIDANDLPESVSLHGQLRWLSSNNPNVFSTQVDGVDLSVSFGGVGFLLPEATFIPEPSTYAFAIGLMLIAFVAIRRMQFVRGIA